MSNLKRIHVTITYDVEKTNGRNVLKQIRDNLTDSAIVGSVEYFPGSINSVGKEMPEYAKKIYDAPTWKP